MKQTTKYIFALVVMILSVTGVMASGNATYIKKIDGVATTGTTDPGSVSLSISGTTGTITVTPAAGNYLTAADLTVIKTVDGSNAEARRRVAINDPIVVTATNATADPSGVTTYTFGVTDATFDYEITADFHSRMSIAGATVTVVGGPFAHTGAAIEPSVTVTLGAATLTEGTDYTLSYASNINVGTGQITVTGNSLGSISTLEDTVYTGSAITPIPVVKAIINNVEVELVKDTDYTLSYSDNINVGTATVSATGIGNYSGTLSQTWEIVNADFTVIADDQTYEYDGTMHGSPISVTTVDSTTPTIMYGYYRNDYNIMSAPQIRNVSNSRKIYYQVTAPNHNTYTGSYYLTINPRLAILEWAAGLWLLDRRNLDICINRGQI